VLLDTPNVPLRKAPTLADRPAPPPPLSTMSTIGGRPRTSSVQSPSIPTIPILSPPPPPTDDALPPPMDDPSLSDLAAPPAAPPLTPMWRDWNAEFIRALELPQGTVEEELVRAEAIKQIMNQFVNEASKLGRVIIREVYLPHHLKTLPPSTAFGGLAGGDKYFHAGILFKFARDSYGLYHGDNYAMKGADHELRGLSSILSANIPQVHIPMMALLDYRGFRLVCSSLLPLSSTSLRYGTGDAGNSVVNTHPLLDARLQQLSKVLNLKTHFVESANSDGRPPPPLPPPPQPLPTPTIVAAPPTPVMVPIPVTPLPPIETMAPPASVSTCSTPSLSSQAQSQAPMSASMSSSTPRNRPVNGRTPYDAPVDDDDDNDAMPSSSSVPSSSEATTATNVPMSPTMSAPGARGYGNYGVLMSPPDLTTQSSVTASLNIIDENTPSSFASATAEASLATFASPHSASSLSSLSSPSSLPSISPLIGSHGYSNYGVPPVLDESWSSSSSLSTSPPASSSGASIAPPSVSNLPTFSSMLYGPLKQSNDDNGGVQIVPPTPSVLLPDNTAPTTPYSNYHAHSAYGPEMAATVLSQMGGRSYAQTNDAINTSGAWLHTCADMEGGSAAAQSDVVKNLYCNLYVRHRSSGIGWSFICCGYRTFVPPNITST
jgi:hypothetical protein